MRCPNLSLLESVLTCWLSHIKSKKSVVFISIQLFFLESHDCPVTFPIHVIRHEVISSQRVPGGALLYTWSRGALRGIRAVQHNTNKLQFERLSAWAAECSSVSLWIPAKHFCFCVICCCPFGPSRRNSSRGSTCWCAYPAQSAQADHNPRTAPPFDPPIYKLCVQEIHFSMQTVFYLVQW